MAISLALAFELAHREILKKNHQTRNNSNPIKFTEDGIPIKKVYVSPIKSFMTNETIRQYFEQFGEVDYVRIHSKSKFRYAFVQFKMAEDTGKVLDQRKHHMMGHWVKVMAADSWHQPPITSPTNGNHLINGNDNNDLASATATSIECKTKLTDINDDCLLEIFSYLNVVELCNVADACPRFRQIASIVFSSRYKNFNFAKMLELEDDLVTLHKARNVLRNFGHLINSLTIQVYAIRSKGMSNNRILELVVRYCGAILSELHLDGFSIKSVEANARADQNSITRKLQPLFAHLHKLTLESCRFGNNVKDLLSSCSELTYLELNKLSIVTGQYIFPKLEKLILYDVGDLSNYSLRELLLQNAHLRKLSIVGCVCISELPFDLIGNNLQQIEELTFYQSLNVAEKSFHNNAQHLSKLKSLKVLTLHCNSFSMTPLIKELSSKNSPIEHLALFKCQLDNEFIHAMSDLKSIKVLKFFKAIDVSDAHIIDLAKHLPMLNELLIKKSKNITTKGVTTFLRYASQLKHLELLSTQKVDVNVEIYNCFLQIVKNRSERVHLTVTFSGSSGQVSVPEDMIKENRKWLLVEELDGHETDYDYIDINVDDDDDDDDSDDYDDEDEDDSDDSSLFFDQYMYDSDSYYDSDGSNNYCYVS